MSDFLQHMALLNIESQVASSGRRVAQAALEAGQAAAQATEGQTRRLERSLANVRSDMIEGFGGVEAQVRRLTTDMGNGLRRLDYGLQKNIEALSHMQATMNVVSDNLVIGFGKILDRLEGIENTLKRIETGVMNPEQTRALERYRTARKLAEAGRPVEAMNHIQSAIANDGGLPLTHLPELMAFRAVLRIGHYDTKTETVFDGPGALSDLEEAIVFAAPDAKKLLKLELAAAHFALQDYQGALALYDGLATRGMGSFASFQMARCNFAMSRPDAAADICRSLLRYYPSTALLFASDPLCQEHAELFVQIGEEERKRRLPAIIAFLDQLRTMPSIEYLLDTLANTFQVMIDLPRYVIDSCNALADELPEIGEAKEKVIVACNRQTKAVVKVQFSFTIGDISKFPKDRDAYKAALADLDRRIAELKPDVDVKDLTLDINADWARIAKVLGQAKSVIDRHADLFKELERLHSMGFEMVGLYRPDRRFDYKINAYPDITLTPETVDSLKPVKPRSFLSLLGLRSPPTEVDEDVMATNERERETIVAIRADTAPSFFEMADALTRYLDVKLEPVRAEANGLADVLRGANSKRWSLVKLLDEIEQENKPMLVGLDT